MDLVTLAGWATMLVTFLMMGSGIVSIGTRTLTYIFTKLYIFVFILYITFMLPACFNMIKKKSTQNVPYFMFLIFVFVGLLGLQYATLIQNKILAFINLISVVVWGVYAGVYLIVTTSKKKALKQLFLVVALYSSHYLYLLFSPQSDVTETLGTFMLIWCIILNVLPAVEFLTIFREHSTNCCDVFMLFGGTISAMVWCFYGYLVEDINIYFPSIPGLFICIFKFALIAYYNKSPKKVD